MHKRNLLLIAMAWAALVMLVLTLPLGLDRTGFAGMLYFPAILLAVALSGRGMHAPAATAMWTGAVLWSLLYWALVLVIYVLFLELYLLRQARGDLRAEPDAALAEASVSARNLHHLGRALGRLEQRRRSHWLLAEIPGLDLRWSAQRLAAEAISHAGEQRAVQHLLNNFEQVLRERDGADSAAAAMRALHAEAGRQAGTGPA